VACRSFAAEFGGSFIATGALSTDALRRACTNYNGQLAIQPVALERLREEVARSAPEALILLPPDYPAAADAGDGEVSPNGYCPGDTDSRALVMRQIRARRGQAHFRNALRARYGDRCAVSGCELLDILEAAHISPYRSEADNDPANGLLLRCDLHTLFYLDLLGVEPETLTVHLHPRVPAYGYREFQGCRLRCGTQPPIRRALEQRWERFRDRRGMSVDGADAVPGIDDIRGDLEEEES
jgi:hypothetical protein